MRLTIAIAAACAASLLGLAHATPAHAATLTIQESGASDQQPTVDTSTSDGYNTVPSTSSGRWCANWHWTKRGYDLFGVTQWSETNHYTWCYWYGGQIYFRDGYDTQYTAPLWNVVKHAWAKHWAIPYTKAIADATATFHSSAGPFSGQTSSVDVCRWEGDKGGTGNC